MYLSWDCIGHSAIKISIKLTQKGTILSKFVLKFFVRLPYEASAVTIVFEVIKSKINTKLKLLPQEVMIFPEINKIS